MLIESVSAKPVRDSRKEFTIEVSIKTNIGEFRASAPNGKSKGKHEAKSYKKNLESDIESLEKLSKYFSKEHLEKFDDLRRIEDIVKGHIGANTLFAFESAVLKGMAKEQKKEIWQLINPNSKKIPRFVGNCIGGGLHSELINGKRPDFQEFLLIADQKSAEKNSKKHLEIKEKSHDELKKVDSKFKEKKNDENAWMTTLNEKEILDILSKFDSPLGLDIASSGFYKRKKYHYKNPPLERNKEEQIMYLTNLIKNYPLIYIEDPFGEEEFESFAELLKKCSNVMIVGDDLTVTNYKRLEKAIEMNAINALIMKPNQNGSLIEVKKVAEFAKKKKIKMIFSHRSGETKEDILADLAVGFEADYIKCGITGPERECKINRIIEIEKQIN